MVWFARGGEAARPDAVEVEVSAGEDGPLTIRAKLPGERAVELSLPADAWIWSPEHYAPLAANLLRTARLNVTPQPAQAGDTLMATLLEARTPELEEQNEGVSSALAANMTNPGGHEDAALLLGALALREAAFTFYDVRQLLCRMASHLALARALRGGPPGRATGAYGEALLMTLAGRGAEAAAALDRLQASAAGGSAEAAWQRVLRLRLTQDWRLLTPGQGLLLERLEHFRALLDTLGSAAVAREKVQRDDASITWAHLALNAADVGTGNELLERTIDLTVLQADTLWSLGRRRPLPETERIAALNEPAQRFVSSEGPRVIAWGTWAAHYQRHIAFLASLGYWHYRRMLGQEESAERFARDMDRRFGGLTLHPFIEGARANDAERPPRRLDEALSIMVHRPELPPTYAWWIVSVASRKEPRRRMPDPSTWFAGCPRGTTYDFGNRAQIITDKARLASLNAIAPHRFHVAQAHLEAAHGRPGRARAALDAFGPRMEYDLRAMRRAEWSADWDSDRELHRSIRSRMCEISPDECFTLGHLLVEMGDEAAAVQVYERALSDVADALTAAGNCRWLVGYYLQTGKRDRARQLAEMAGRTYSGAGLLTLASYLEKTGQVAAAEKVIISARERYPDADYVPQLLAFYYRSGHLRGIKKYLDRFRRESRDIFPDGLEKIDRSSLAGPPADGAQTVDLTPPMRRAGIWGGEVIVALDGWRVRSPRQYAVIRQLDDSPDVRWLVWKTDRYLEVTLRSVNCRFGARLQPFPARKRAGDEPETWL